MIKRLRIFFETIFFIGILLMFLDFTGTLHHYLAWMAKLQFWPAITSATIVGCLCAVIIIILTLIFGRIYCSTICPLGALQDITAHLWQKILHKLQRRTETSTLFTTRGHYNYSKEKKWLRYSFLVVMIALFPLGMMSLLEPYSAFGRIVTTLLRPLYILGNNQLAGLAERADSYLFYRGDVLLTGGVTLIVAVVTILIICFLAARHGRTYCNTVCPVGTLLSLFSRHSYLRIRIDADKCRNCGRCVKNCKASCIDLENHTIDASRCIVCGDCIEKCGFSAMEYVEHSKTRNVSKISKTMDGKDAMGVRDSRRGFLVTMAMATTAATLGQEKKKVDGGLAAITDKQAPKRKMPILPPGAMDMKHMSHHCTACQLCVSACPNKVLRPSTSLEHFMQPYMSYESGYCRPECHACSSVCPAGAIHDIGLERKASTKIGTAVFLHKNCLALAADADCGLCSDHCPTNAITMVHSDPKDETSPMMPSVDETRCIGCGACENMCPARPFSAIYVEGIEVQKEV